MTFAGEVHISALDYSHGTLPLRGFLARSLPRDEPTPGVLVAPEWWGANAYVQQRALQLARRGYIALAIDMYGDGRTTADANTATALARDTRTGPLARERATCALDLLRCQPGVDPARLAAVGFCFGGSVVLELARAGADLRGVASFHGSLATPIPAQRETLKASILVLHGADDTFVSDDELRNFSEEMRAADADWQLFSYGSALHSFSNPSADVAAIPGVSYDARSERRSWQAFESFLDEIFAR
jgi:dienelactone hydrolase